MNKYTNKKSNKFDGIVMFLLKVIFIPTAYILKILFYFCFTILNLFNLVDKKINKR